MSPKVSGRIQSRTAVTRNDLVLRKGNDMTEEEAKAPPILEEEVKVPTTLEEAFDWLAKLDRVEDFKASNPVEFHHGLGRWIRNNWGFWTKEGPLYNWFVSLGITHPDDMSGIILESFHRKLHDKPLDLEGQVQHYKDYWKKQDEENA